MQKEIYSNKNIKPGCETDLPDDKDELSETKFGKFHTGGTFGATGTIRKKES